MSTRFPVLTHHCALSLCPPACSLGHCGILHFTLLARLFCRLQPAENAVLAPIMLYGPPEQQHLARAFISTKFNKDTPEACDSLIAKLKETVKQDDEGTWVRAPAFALELVPVQRF